MKWIGYSNFMLNLCIWQSLKQYQSWSEFYITHMIGVLVRLCFGITVCSKNWIVPQNKYVKYDTLPWETIKNIEQAQYNKSFLPTLWLHSSHLLYKLPHTRLACLPTTITTNNKYKGKLRKFKTSSIIEKHLDFCQWSLPLCHEILKIFSSLQLNNNSPP